MSIIGDRFIELGDKFIESDFVILHKSFGSAPELKGLSIYARYLYAYMLDRAKLSYKNKWVDENNRIYIHFTIEEIMNVLNVGKDRSIKTLDELDEKNGVGLIKRKKQGFGKPSIIYVKSLKTHPVDKSEDNSSSAGTEVDKIEFKKSEIPNSRSRQNRIQEVGNTDTNNTEYNNTDNSYTYPIQSYHNNSDTEPANIENRIREREDYKEIIRDNIDYTLLVKKHGKKDINAIVNIMLDSVCSKSPEIKIGKDFKPQCVVKGRMLELDMSHIDYVLECLRETKTRIYKMKDYMLTALYDSPDTIGLYYTNLFNRSYGANNGFEHHKTFT